MIIELLNDLVNLIETLINNDEEKKENETVR